MTTIALIAHDGKKDEMVAFAREHRDVLGKHSLVGTGTTGGLVAEETGLRIERMLSGPIGGDVQIAARVVVGEIAAVLFFLSILLPSIHTIPIFRLYSVLVMYITFL